ncbi:hypothetical protein H4R34_005077 [Dimargaris verticillata]|uniref:Glycosyl transferase family 25 domain-containing protein n=1 Tax=Dimargaris verticillata TaxID=2761393 RepID=A0A9W8B3M6_9FUNG|nr:hypothetical protein H4R34_005077 [Dimargaris verticillata]
MGAEQEDLYLECEKNPLVEPSTCDNSQPKTDVPRKRLRCLLKCLLHGLIVISIVLQLIGLWIWYTQYHVKSRPTSTESTNVLPINASGIHRATANSGQGSALDLPASLAPEREGVDHVYVVNLESRTDRKDMMSILMHYTELDVEFFPGTTPDTLGFVPGEDERPKSLTKGQLACWRSHMNVYRDIVSKGYRHALILEDDVDLEIDTKSLVVDMIPRLPKDWDLFYAGHCGYVNPKDQVDNRKPSLLKFHRTGCTHGYVISLRGAARLLYLLHKPTNPIDLMIMALAEQKSVQAFTTNPQWITQVRRPNDPSSIPGSDVNPLWEGLHNSTRALARANLDII